MIISVDSEKAYGKINHSFSIKVSGKLQIEKNFLKLVLGVYEKSTNNIILNIKNFATQL